jgi:hypothetical protein
MYLEYGVLYLILTRPKFAVLVKGLGSEFWGQRSLVKGLGPEVSGQRSGIISRRCRVSSQGVRGGNGSEVRIY